MYGPFVVLIFMMDIYARFHQNFSTNYGDIASREIQVDWQRKEGRTNNRRTTDGQPYGQPENVMLFAYYCWRRHNDSTSTCRVLEASLITFQTSMLHFIILTAV